MLLRVSVQTDCVQLVKSPAEVYTFCQLLANSGFVSRLSVDVFLNDFACKVFYIFGAE